MRVAGGDLLAVLTHEIIKRTVVQRAGAGDKNVGVGRSVVENDPLDGMGDAIDVGGGLAIWRIDGRREMPYRDADRGDAAKEQRSKTSGTLGVSRNEKHAHHEDGAQHEKDLELRTDKR